MATLYWAGSSAPITQVTTISVGGTVASGGSTWTVTIGGKSVVTVGGSTTLATVATAIVTALNALNATLYPEFASITWATTSGGAFTGTARTSGVPFTVSLATNDGTGTFTQTATTAASGPNFWNVGANWSTGSVPASGDTVYIQNTAVPILYGLSNAAVLLNNFYIDQSFTGTIGLPVTNAAGYAEYRGQYLLIGMQTNFITTIGNGFGAGSGRIKINFGSTKAFVTVLNSGSPAEAVVKSILILTTNSSSTLTVEKGSVGAAVFAGETTTFVAVNVGFVTSVNGDSDVRLGSGVTLSSAAIVKTGGALELNSTFSSLVHYGGETNIVAGAPGTMTIEGGAVRYKTSGTYTAATVANGGTLDFSQDMQSRTGTNTTLNNGFTLLDPAKTVTFTNPIALNCPLADGTLNLGSVFNLQRS